MTMKFTAHMPAETVLNLLSHKIEDCRYCIGQVGHLRVKHYNANVKKDKNKISECWDDHSMKIRSDAKDTQRMLQEVCWQARFLQRQFEKLEASCNRYVESMESEGTDRSQLFLYMDSEFFINMNSLNRLLVKANQYKEEIL